MAVKEILKAPHEMLSTVAAPVLITDGPMDIEALIQDLKDTVNAPYGKLRSVGLSAPQIGVSKRVLVLNHDRHENLIMINPKLVEAVGRIKHDEMCLSYPGMKRRRTRRQTIRVEYLNEKFELMTQTFFALTSVILQHELDHLDGKGLDHD